MKLRRAPKQTKLEVVKAEAAAARAIAKRTSMRTRALALGGIAVVVGAVYALARGRSRGGEQHPLPTREPELRTQTPEAKAAAAAR